MGDRNKLTRIVFLAILFLSLGLCLPTQGAYEEFTFYTEVDPNTHITVTNNTYATGDLYMNEDAYLHTPYAQNKFYTDFAHRVDVYYDNSSTSAVNHNASVWALADSLDDRKGLEDTSESFLSLNVEAEPRRLGNWTTSGTASHDWGGGDDAVGCIFTTPASPTYALVVTSITVYIRSSAGSYDFKCAIYKNSDLSRIAFTFDRTMTGVWQWIDCPFASYPTLEANTAYLLCVWGDVGAGLFRTAYHVGDAGQTARDIEAYGVWPDPFVKDDVWAEEFCIYANFEPQAKMTIEESFSGTNTFSETANLTFDTWYYLLLSRDVATSNFTCGLYSTNALRNAGGTPDLATLNITLSAIVSYDYAYGLLTYNSGVNEYLSMNIRYYDFQYDYEFTFRGVYEEPSGDPMPGGCDVTIIFDTGTPPITYAVDGSRNVGFYEKPLYFVFNLTTYEREYWLASDENSGTIYIFNATSHNSYTIQFYDLAGILDDTSIIVAQRYVNSTLHTVEKIRVDVQKKVLMSLILNDLYTLVVVDTINHGGSYTYGALRMTPVTTVALTLKGIEFPLETLLTYSNVRIYGLRAHDIPTGNITITYEDLLSQTNDVFISIDYVNGTNAYNSTEASSSFVHQWASADNSTSYSVTCTIDHQRYGVYDWGQYFPAWLSSTAPWGLRWFGTLSFDTTYLIPILLILICAGCFSVLSVEAGAILTVVMTAIFAYMGWLPIDPALLISAFAFSILLAITYAKRRVMS